MTAEAWTTLIDRAAKVCGSQTALSERLGVSRQRISAVKMGKEGLTEQQICALAGLLNEDAEEVGALHDVMRMAALSKHKRALAKAAAVFFSLVVIGANVDARAVRQSLASNTLHIVALMRSLALMARGHLGRCLTWLARGTQRSIAASAAPAA